MKKQIKSKEKKQSDAGYWAVIPATVMYSQVLSANAKLLYGAISGLCYKEGYCWSSNAYLAKLFNVSESSITKKLADLEKFKVIRFENGHNQLRKIYIVKE